MCRSIHEASKLGQTRIRCDLPGCEGYEAKRDLATANRRESRAVRRRIAVFVRDSLGGDQKAKRAVMNARPREMAVIIAHMETVDPSFAKEMRAAAGVDQLPGLHNMTLQESRRETVGVDYDAVGDMKKDPGMVSMAMRQISQLESAYLDSDEARSRLSQGKIAELRRVADLRSEMSELGLFGSSDDQGRHVPPPSVKEMSNSQLAFYNHASPETLSRIGDTENTVEDEFVAYAMRNVEFYPGRRGRLCSDEQAGKTADELVGSGDFDTTGSMMIREGVDLHANPEYDADDPDSLEPKYFFRVDGGVDLPVDPNKPIGEQSNVIPQVGKIQQRAATEVAPDDQSSLYDRLLDPGTSTGRRTHGRIKEDIIRAAYTSGRIPGIDTSIDVTAEEAGHRSGRRPGAHTLGSLYGAKSPLSGRTRDVTGQVLAMTRMSLTPEMKKAREHSELSHLHLNNQREAIHRRANAVRRKEKLWAGRSPVTNTKPPKDSKRAEHDLGGLSTTRALKEREHRKLVVPGVKALRNKEGYKRIPPVTGATIPSTQLQRNRITGPNQTMSAADVQAMVDEANLAQKNPSVDATPTGAHTALARLSRADEQNRLSLDRGSKWVRDLPESERPARPKPVTAECYYLVDESTHGHNMFREGRSSHTNGYQVVTTTKGEPPTPGPGQKVVRAVYSTTRAMPANDTTAVISPKDNFRILRRSKVSSGGIETVHFVDEGEVLDASVAASASS